MPSYFTTITAERTLKATQEEYEDLKAALEGNDLAENYDEWSSGFEITCNDGEVFVFSPDGDWETLPNAFLSQLGALIAKNGLTFLEFGAAFISSRDVPGSAGGTYFRIKSNGSLWEPRFKWRCSRRVKRRSPKTPAKPSVSTTPQNEDDPENN